MRIMLDVQNAPAAPPATIRREDYRPPDWLVPEIKLEFELDAERTIVRSVLHVEPAATAGGRSLRLNGDGIEAAAGQGVQGTPTFFLNGANIGSHNWSSLEPILKEAAG